jgi:hypothetical protein
MRSGDASAIRGRFERTGIPKFGPRIVTLLVPSVFVLDLTFFVPLSWAALCVGGFLLSGCVIFVVGLTGHPRFLISRVFRDLE